MSSKTTKIEDQTTFSDAELGLETPSSPAEGGLDKAKSALESAAANTALKAAMIAEADKSVKEAEKTYIIEKKRHMLNRCKTDEPVEFTGQKIFANIFGPVYTFLYNGIPVTIRFDGSKQTLPRFIYNRVMEKINEVSDSNTSKVIIEDRSEVSV